MKMVMIRSNHGYKIITKCNAPQPALVLITEFLRQSNKSNPVKVGIYNVNTRKDSDKVRVYSYIANRTDIMTRAQYKKFLEGKRQLVKPNALAGLTMSKRESVELNELFSPKPVEV